MAFSDYEKRRLNGLRTKLGPHGERFIDMEGVVYPDSALVDRLKNGLRVVLREAPRVGWMTTAQCAQLLECSESAARERLHRLGVRHEFVLCPAEQPRLYWEPKAVQRVVDGLLPVVDCVPEGFVATEEAVRMLGCARSTLYRWQRSGKVPVQWARLRTRMGTRKVCFYPKEALTEMRGFAVEHKELCERLRDLERRWRTRFGAAMPSLGGG